MKGWRCSFLALFLIAVSSRTLLASEPSSHGHHVVMEITGGAPEHWKSLLDNIDHERETFTDGVEIEVVAHGKALAMLTKDDQDLAQRMNALAEKGVVFAACEKSMKREHVTKDGLLPFAMTVDAGVAEVVRKQEKGWSYLRLDQ